MIQTTIFSPKAFRLNFHSSPFLATNQNVFSRGFALINTNKTRRHSMFLSSKPVLKDGTLSISGKEALTEVPENVVVTPLTNSSAFVGATSTDSSSRHVFKLGVIRVWWMIPRIGSSGSDIPVETQMLLLEASKGTDLDDQNETSYAIFLPVLDGEFRSSLQGNSSNELEFCVESGDPEVVTSESLKAIFVNSGDHPFDLMQESMKWTPGMLDYFGWCTWDAFYQDVNPQGIRKGLESLSQGGTPAKFLIIDDGWQDVENEFQKEGEPFVEGSQFGGRLASIKENTKFRRASNDAQSEAPTDLKSFVSEIKSTFGLKYVYMWHALLGYWGGLVPNAPGTKKYNPKLKYPLQSPGNLANSRDSAMDGMEKYGVGVIDAEKAHQFLDDLHRYLVSQNVDGVKVDVQNILEMVSAGFGGRVSLTKQFQQALEKSIASNFQDNSIICCMGQSNDSVYHSKRSAVTRASDDYYPKNPATQTLHVAAVAYNSIFLGEVFVPDWDMFYSLHDAAEFHAAARAVGGCGVYVSDKPGHHDFEILKRLVLPDGSILRAKYPGRPSRDCLFIDPVMDGTNLLKIWNLNNCTGVLGVFNCQEAGIWPCLKNPVKANVNAAKISGQVSPADIEYFEEVSGTHWTGDCAVFSFSSGSLSRLPKDESLNITLKVLQCDVLTVSPIKVYHQNIEFAPIGLVNMYNSGGAVERIDFFSDSSNNEIRIVGRGTGSFGAYSTTKPKHCSINSTSEEFKYRSEDNLLTVTIPDATINWDITFYY
ncbi:hypothetical protein L484_017952 [Morus notabilis]|uniref:galactinol--sucrose galactosyltransferase n=1 Tax=Morus notabilis TaxID=981085 RepID=W9RCJ5_9ROSA|nr:hypothetical protein L484_017952 [Morus notabilis]